MKSQPIDICSFFFLTLVFKKGSKHSDMHTDQPVHDLNLYVLCTYVLFLSQYADAGSKLDQTAQFHCFI